MVAATAVLVGCTPPIIPVAVSPEPMVLPDFVAADYVQYAHPGTGELSGQAFLTTRGGDVKVAAGRSVTLDPATPYARAWYEKYGRMTDAMPPAPGFAQARRTTVADAEGRFRFTNLPQGSYIARTTVTWETGAASAGLQGGIVSDTVNIGTGAKNELILNTVYTPPSVAASLKPVIVLSQEQLAGRNFRRIRSVEGISCSMRGFEPISEDDARARMIDEARKVGADAVTSVICQRGGLTLRHNCMAHFKCVGDALAWT